MKFQIFRNPVSLGNAIVSVLLLFSHVESSIAQPAAADATAKPACVFSEDAQQQARRLVERTDEYRTVQREATQADPVGRVAYIDGMDQPVLWKGRCHQSVTVYVDRLNRFERRFTMLVDLGTGKLFLEDFNGEYQALKKSVPGRAKSVARPTGS